MVLGGLVAAGLLAAAVLYLLQGVQRGNALEAELAAQLEKLANINNAEFTASPANVKLARENTERVAAFQAGAQKMLVDASMPELDDAKFRALLDTAIYELSRGCSNATIIIPPKYAFTFGAQLGKLKYAPGSLEPCYRQLQDLKAISGVLIAAKIHSIESLRRVRVSVDDPKGDSAYLEDQTLRTNSFAVIAPYEVSFKGFSPELAAVLNGLARTPEFFVVKNLTVLPEGARVAVDSTTMTNPAPPVVTGSGGGKKGAAPPPAQRRVTILDERPLRITLSLESVRPLQPAK